MKLRYLSPEAQLPIFLPDVERAGQGVMHSSALFLLIFLHQIPNLYQIQNMTT